MAMLKPSSVSKAPHEIGHQNAPSQSGVNTVYQSIRNAIDSVFGEFDFGNNGAEQSDKFRR
jgi:hypothetical protein